VWNFEIPTLGSSFVKYFRDTTQMALSDVGTLQTFLSLPDANERYKKAFWVVAEIIPRIDQSVEGKTVVLLNDPDQKPFLVVKQAIKEDGTWLLLNPQGKVLTEPRWVKLEDVKIQGGEEELWASE
jgi:hypothetical protein